MIVAMIVLMIFRVVADNIIGGIFIYANIRYLTFVIKGLANSFDEILRGV